MYRERGGLGKKPTYIYIEINNLEADKGGEIRGKVRKGERNDRIGRKKKRKEEEDGSRGRKEKGKRD